MNLLYEHGNELAILVLSPVLGIILDYSIKTKYTLWALGVTAVFLLPILTDYEYIIPYALQIVGLSFVSLLYSLYSKQITQASFKFLSATVLFILLAIVLGHAAFMDSFGGQTDINHVWKKDEYRIEKKTFSGFSGKPSVEYSLKKHAWIPLFLIEIDVVMEVDSRNPCLIHFPTENITLNQCDNSIHLPEN